MHIRRYELWVGLLLVLATGVFFRLMWLGESAFRADTIIFYNFCHSPTTAWQIFFDWFQVFSPTEQFPFAPAFTKGFIDCLHLPVTDFTIRLPCALLGIATVLFAFLAGRELSGRRFGFFFALVLACNSFHIQLSREAYFYPPVVLGAAMQLYSVLWLFRRRRVPGCLPWYFHMLAGIGFFMLTYGHFSGWWLAALVVPIMLGILIWRIRRLRGHGRDLAIWLVVYGVVGIPLLFCEWGVPFILSRLTNPEIKESVIRAFGARTTSIFDAPGRLAEGLSFGTTPLGIGLIILAGLLLIVYFIRHRPWTGRYGIVLLLLFGAMSLYVAASMIQEINFARRYISMVLPLFLILVTAGLWHLSLLGRWLGLKSAIRRLMVYAVAAVAIATLLPAAWWSITITGQPTPFKEVARWCDTQLPSRTLVLVERWFDPWNELRVHNSTNVFFTFTVPSEPSDVFKQYNWPATAKAFFTKFPDAAYLEYCNSERARMGVLSNWHFARSMVFTNLAGIKLARAGLAFRDDFYDPATNRMITTVFYNTRDDVIRHAREQGQTTLVLYAPSWGYIKLWQQLKDFRDWRILEDKATLDIYNLTQQTNTVTLLISGMAVNGSKHVRCGMSGQTFQHLKLSEWRIESVLLKPGLNQIVLTDAIWATARIPLLVDRAEVAGEEVGGRRSEGSEQ